MSKKNCVNCANADWVKTKTGKRKLLNGWAECKVEIKFPLSYASHWGIFPSKSSVGVSTCKNQECSHWSPIKINKV